MLNRKVALLAGAVGAAALLAPNAVLAQSAPADEQQLRENDIVITARRRDEQAQDVPVTVTAIGATALREQRIVNTQDIQNVTPALRITPQISAITPNFIIRGQGRPLFTGAMPAVVTYLNDVPLPQDGSIAPIYDLSSVQVLKGPQGTLFGRNTTGGAILLTPQAPEFDVFGGFLEAAVGSYDARELRGAVNIPLHRTLALRVAGESVRRDGIVENLSGGRDLDDRHADSARVSLRWRPTDSFENLLIYDRTEIDQSGGGIVLSGVFTDESGAVLGLLGTAANAPYFLGGTIDNDVRLMMERQIAEGPRTARPGIDPYSRAVVWGVSNTTTWDVGAVTLKNIFGYRRVTLFDRIDVDGIPLAINDRFNGDGAFPQVDLEQITNEFQVVGDLFDGRVDYILGAFFLDESPAGPVGAQARQFYRAGSAAPIVTSTYIGNESRALFGQATYHFGGALEGLNLVGGYPIRGMIVVSACCRAQACKRGVDALRFSARRISPSRATRSAWIIVSMTASSSMASRAPAIVSAA